MTRTILGGYVLTPAEIYTTIGTITILRTGERIATKHVHLVLMECEGCKRPVTDKRELPFAKQSGMCYQCCTGNILDFCHRTICRTIPDKVVPAAGSPPSWWICSLSSAPNCSPWSRYFSNSAFSSGSVTSSYAFR